MKKKILYLDMDNVLVDFPSGLARIAEETQREYEGRADEIPGVFALMDPMPGAVEAFNTLADAFDVYILSTSPWENASAWSDKLKWVKKHLGEKAWKRLILSHHKNLNQGDFLVDDRDKNGAGEFTGTSSSSNNDMLSLILFGFLSLSYSDLFTSEYFTVPFDYINLVLFHQKLNAFAHASSDISTSVDHCIKVLIVFFYCKTVIFSML